MLLLKKHGIDNMDSTIAEREFVIEAPQQRVWPELPRMILNSVEGMEQIEFIDEENFAAKVNLKWAFLSLSVPTRGRILEIAPSRAAMSASLNFSKTAISSKIL